MLLNITTVNDKTFYAFRNTEHEIDILIDIANDEFIKTVDINGRETFLKTSVIESIRVDNSKSALDKYRKCIEVSK
ncbi:hypothetical protein LUL50_000690 [Staphylococcus pseudintermedius]|nr:hypothetical protein [Staphylococcus pseudintermedius]